MKKFLFLLIIVFSTPALADINPQTVNNMRAQVNEFGHIDVAGNVNNIQLNLTMPQEDVYQRIESFVVSDSNGICAGSCSYSFVYDNLGNKLLSINWKNPINNIDFSVNLTVSVSRRYTVEMKTYSEFLKPTNLVQSTNSEIASLASNARGTDFDKVAYLSKWINENIRFNTVYSDVNLPATEILQLKVGVCKEFSNLLVSFLRNLGYYSAVTVGYVYPGRIYTGQNFQPHGWTEVYTGEGILSDPTWAEVGYLDATHIKFATFPDSKWTFSSIYSTGFGSFTVNLKSTNVSVSLLNYSEDPVLSFTSKSLEDNLWKGYAILKTDITSDRCLLTKLDIRSCNSDTGEFLEKLNKDNVTYFCNNKSVFTIFKIPDLERNRQYTCPIAILVYGSSQQNIPFSFSFGEEGSTQLSVDKTAALPNEKISASAANSYIFTDGGGYGFGNLETSAPYYDFNIYSYNKGALDQQKISVVLSKPFDAFLYSNDTAYVGKSISVIVNVKSLQDSQVTVKIGNQVESDYVSGSKNFSFNFTPQSKDDNLIQAVVSTNDFSTSISKQINVLEELNATNFFGGIWKAITDFFNWIFSLFK